MSSLVAHATLRVLREGKQGAFPLLLRHGRPLAPLQCREMRPALAAALRLVEARRWPSWPLHLVWLVAHSNTAKGRGGWPAVPGNLSLATDGATGENMPE